MIISLQVFMTSLKNNSHQPLIYALSGGISSGKTSACHIFKRLGARIINADLITHQLLEPNQIGYQKIHQLFGDNILDKNSNQIDKQKLKKIIFDDNEKKALVESIIHPNVRLAIEKAIEKYQEEKLIIIEIPLLKEKSDYPYLTGTIFIDIDEKTKLERLLKREDIDLSLAKKIIHSQAFLEDTKKAADYIIDNNGNLNDLENKIQKLIKEIASR